jgi:2-octaprenylphenol hydroxylase
MYRRKIITTERHHSKSAALTMDHQVDVIILGGGVVGLTLAACLSRAELRIAIVDAQKKPSLTEMTSTDHRVVALNLASKDILTEIDVWQRLTTTHAAPFVAMQAWDAQGFGNIHFDSDDIGELALGYIVHQHHLQVALWQQLQSSPFIHDFTGQRVSELVRTANGASLVLATPESDQPITISGRLLVGADGAQSYVRRTLGIETHQRDYDQSAIVATVMHDQPHQSIARQSFLPDGPLAFLPLHEAQTSSIVWSVSHAQAEHLSHLTEAQFCDELSSAFHYRLGRVISSSAPLAFPLRMMHAKSYVQDAIVLIGDAAHTIHPLAGQGLNLGLQDAACLAEVISTAHARNRNFASYATLRAYERARKGPNWLMMGVMESFHQLFTASSSTISVLRNYGLNCVDRSCLKYFFMRKATGV